MRLPEPGNCMFCSIYRPVRGAYTFVDTFGYRYLLCERHFAPIARWRGRLAQTQEQRLARRTRDLERRRGGG